jgi:Peptide methionine sulfoxide reductase
LLLGNATTDKAPPRRPFDQSRLFRWRRAECTYRNHGTHAEAIEIVFNPDETTYRDLLEFFFQIHDPTTPNRQGNDRGTSYRSAIFYTSDEQRRTAEETIADVNASSLWPGPSLRKLRRPAISGKRNRSIKIIWSASRVVTPATSLVRTGSCLGETQPDV